MKIGDTAYIILYKREKNETLSKCAEGIEMCSIHVA